MAHPQAVVLVREGIAAGRAGDKAKMRVLLRQATDLDPENETAWVWRANGSESPEESLDFLRRACAINPNNEYVRSSLPDALVRVAAACVSDRPKANKLLQEATSFAPRHELAWLWRAGLAETTVETVGHLRTVLSINPDNQKALAGLAKCEQQAPRVWHCPICAATTTAPKPACESCQCILSVDAPAAFDGVRAVNRPTVEGAAKRLHAAYRQSPNSTTAFSLGLAYLNLGFYEQGVQAVQAAVRLNGANPLWANQLAALLEHRAAQASRAASDARSTAAKPVVLVVDDSPTIRKLVTVTLVPAGYRVVEAESGFAAAKQIRDYGAPGLFLLDINMPEMDGFTLCKSLRANPETAKTPVVFLTGKDGLISKLRGQWAGASDYLTKPFDPQKLLAAVGKLLPVAAPR